MSFVQCFIFSSVSYFLMFKRVKTHVCLSKARMYIWRNNRIICFAFAASWNYHRQTICSLNAYLLERKLLIEQFKQLLNSGWGIPNESTGTVHDRGKLKYLHSYLVTTISCTANYSRTWCRGIFSKLAEELSFEFKNICGIPDSPHCG